MSAISLIAILCVSLPDSQDQELAKAINNAYEANRLLFPFGTIRFRYFTGHSASEADALFDKLSDVVVAEGLFAFDGGRGRYECVFSPDSMATSEKLGQKLHSVRLITDGSSTLWDRLGVIQEAGTLRHTHSTQIEPGTSSFYREVMSPLKVGVSGQRMALLPQTDAALRGEGELRVVSIEKSGTLEGQPVVVWHYESPRAKSSLWINLERGAVPVQIRHTDSKTGAVYLERNDQLQNVEHRGWLPFRKLVRLPDGSTRVFTVQSANFSDPPSSVVFEMEFEKPISIIDVARYVKHKPRTRVSLGDISRPNRATSDRLPAAVSEPLVAAITLPGEREPRPWWSVPVIALGILSLLAAGIVVYRKRHHAH